MKSMLKSLMSVAAAALALTSCSTDTTEDVMPNGGFKTLVVNASIDQTRTVMAADHVKLKWSEGDEILCYIGENATTKADAKKINPLTGGTITGVTYENGNTVYANYSLDNEDFSEGVKKAEIKIDKAQTQTAANVFAGVNLPMTAKGTIADGKVNLTFKPVGCVLVFNVYGSAYNANEKIKSIKFETSVGCCGYGKYDLTAESLGYKAYDSNKSAEVTLTTPAAIDASKPGDTKIGENQVYLVVAPSEYPAGSKFTVTTDANNAYNFTTTSALDCSKTTARVVNLNLAKAPEMQPAIEVPDVPEQKSEGGDLVIENIVLKNITASDATVAVYSDKELTTELTESWLTVKNTADLANGKLSCNVAPNATTESRTVYIGIKYGETVKAAIAVTQVGAGSTPTVNAVATYTPSDAIYSYNRGDKVTNVSLNNDVTLAFGNAAYYDPALRCYKGSTITVTSTSKITEIKFVRSSAKPGNLSTVVGTWSRDTFVWTGESDKVVLTVINDQFHIESMEITYVESNEPKIIVPTVADKQPAEGSTLKIQNIVFKNIDVANVTTGVYSDAELTESTNVAWLTIANADLANGTLSCNVAANTGAERTAYIGIKGGGVQAAIAVTQLAQGAVAAPDPTTAVLSTVIAGSYGPHDNDTWIVTCGGNTHTLGSNSSNDSKCNLDGYTALAEAMDLTTSERAAAVISKKVLPAGYNTAKLEYSKTNEDMFVGIAFSTDNVTWTKIKDFVELKETAAAGSQTYSFTQQEAGYYAFVAKGNAAGMRIQTCKITYSQSQE